ncbi:MAG: N-acetylmuramoyl-L-alanine amidase, partial [Saprospiraceae bacterium]|nr:N-acetylmuramoyl-L-alanine amidase [Saprospiraceae bacterium]
MIFSLIFALAFKLLTPVNDNFLYHHAVPARSGDGPLTLLQRYDLDDERCDVEAFYALNGLAQDAMLYSGRKYKLPVLIYRYNGTSIRSTINDTDYQKALRIQHYNEWLQKKSLRKTDYRDSKILWVPYHELHCAVKSKPASVTSAKVNTAEKKLKLPILGTREAIVIRKTKKLEGHVYYLIAGHGGPDPGAVGSRGQNTLCEDEYAYDVTLRLYKLLIEQGAQAYMIIQDKNDGIRDDAILTCDRDETCHGAKIPLNQAKRLKQRVAHVNQLFYHHQKKGVKAQTCLSIHVDSRSRNHRQDVFFCHYPSSKSSKKLATQMQKTFAKKYGVHRQGGHYAGCVSERGNLYVLKNTLPKAVLVELSNIQNKSDHRRIIQ